MIKKSLENLINRKYYNDKEKIVNKCDVFFAMDKLTEEDYIELMMLIDEVYPEVMGETIEEKPGDLMEDLKD